MMCHMNRSKRLVLLLIVGLVCASQVFAYQFSPLEQVFAPTGADSTKTYTIVNDSDDSIAIEVSALTRDQDADGNEVNATAAAYFSIVPAKVIVKPQSTQLVRVQYRGPKTVTNELSFRLRAEQIPYSQGKNAEEKSMFNFLYVYTTSLYVQPTKTIERVQVQKIEAVKGEDGADMMAVTLVNSGNIHQILVDASLEVVASDGKSVTLTGNEQLTGLSGMNILAKKTVTKLIPWPQDLPLGTNATYKGNISYTK